MFVLGIALVLVLVLVFKAALVSVLVFVLVLFVVAVSVLVLVLVDALVSVLVLVAALVSVLVLVLVPAFVVSVLPFSEGLSGLGGVQAESITNAAEAIKYSFVDRLTFTTCTPFTILFAAGG